MLSVTLSCNRYKYKFSSTSSGTFPEGFSSDYVIVSESDGTIRIPFYLHHKTIQDLDITLESAGPGIGAKEGVDFELRNIIVGEIRPSLLKYDIEIGIKNNFIPQPDRFFQLVVNGKFAKTNFKKSIVIFIKDDDHYLQESAAAGITYLNSVKISEGQSLVKVAYSPETNHLYGLGEDNSIVKMSFPKSRRVSVTAEQTFIPDKAGKASGLIFFEGFLIVTIDNGYQKKGEILLLDENLSLLDRKETGFSPKNPVSSPGRNLIAVPCKGYPAPDYSIDPLGSVVLFEVDREKGVFEKWKQINFTESNLSRNRLTRNGVRIKGPFASIAQDLEPQSLDFLSDNSKLVVNFQENNCFGIVDLETLKLDTLYSFRSIDHAEAGSGFDAQRNILQPLIINWPVHSLLQPDDFCVCRLKGEEYIVTANSGRPRQYDLYNETKLFSALNPRASDEDLTRLMEFNNELMLGDLIISNVDGDTDLDGYIDRVVKFGSRSISIFNVNNGRRVWDSGEQIERQISVNPTWKSIFNADFLSNTAKSTSSFLGVKPSRIICKETRGKVIAFVLLENFGGVAVFDISEPGKGQIIGYENSRQYLDIGGDLRPADLVYIESRNSGFDYDILVVANKESGSLSFYQVNY